MLLKRWVLDGIKARQIDRVYRRWTRSTVKSGGTLHTAIGVLAIDALEEVSRASITERDARRAGYATRKELLDDLRPGTGTIYCIRLRRAGADPRLALRQNAKLDDADFAAVEARLARLDGANRHGAWTGRVLRLIGARPGTRAADLADSLGRERLAFKADVRKLKRLGLTESLDVGYRLSPRGKAVLRRIGKA